MEIRREGEVVAAILDAAEEADLIVMTTDGRNGAFDAMRGSVTERVVRGAHCPVLAIPPPHDDRVKLDLTGR